MLRIELISRGREFVLDDIAQILEIVECFPKYCEDADVVWIHEFQLASIVTRKCEVTTHPMFESGDS
jgi:hypothetical protein